MTEKSAYTEPDTDSYSGYRYRLYRPRVSTFWWLRQRSYLVFAIRELSSVFVAWFVVFLLLMVLAVSRGDEAYQQFLALSAAPWMLLLNAVALFFVVFHAVTWFRLAPQAIVVRMRGKRVPRTWVMALHYVAWALVSALVVWVLVG